MVVCLCIPHSHRWFVDSSFDISSLVSGQVFHLSGQVFYLSWQVFHLSGQVFSICQGVFYLLGQVFQLSDKFSICQDRFSICQDKFSSCRTSFSFVRTGFLAVGTSFANVGQVFRLSGQVFRLSDKWVPVVLKCKAGPCLENVFKYYSEQTNGFHLVVVHSGGTSRVKIMLLLNYWIMCSSCSINRFHMVFIDHQQICMWFWSLIKICLFYLW